MAGDNSENCEDEFRGLTSVLRQKLVFLDHGCHSDFSLGLGVFHAYDAPLTLHPDTFSQCDLRRKGEREADRRSFGDRRVQVKANASSAHVADLGRFAAPITVPADTYWHTKRKASCCPLLVVNLGHASSKWR